MMPPQVIAAIIGVSSALFGTLVGGLISYFANKDLKLREWRLSMTKEELASRRKIYSDFLSEANRLVYLSLKKEAKSLPRELDLAISYFSQVQLIATEEVLQQAKEVLNCLLRYSQEPSSELNQPFPDVRKGFIEAVKHELAALRNGEGTLD